MRAPVSPLVETVGASGCLASDGRTNLAGEAKAAALAVWKRARRAIGVGLGAGLARKVRALDGEARFLPGLGGGPRDWFGALRPHQWVKNVLVFVPLAAAHETGAGPYLVAAGVFAALSAVASGTYLLNDLLDLPHDRGHPAKRHRPMAAGKVPLLPMIGIGAALAAGGLALAFWLSAAAGLWVLVYLAVTCAYSLSLKRKTFIDVTALAMLYCSSGVDRCGGGVGSPCPPGCSPSSCSCSSPWLSSSARASCVRCSGPAGPPPAAGPILPKTSRSWRRWARRAVSLRW